MEQKAMYNISYGIFVLGSTDGEKINACITNTCIQVANDPVRIAISVLNKNLTCDFIKKSKVFSLSILDKTTSFELIKHFGFQSGRDVNKFADFSYELDNNNSPFIKSSVCSVLQCKVLSSQDLGTHTLFIAEVQDAKLLSTEPPLTYAYYQSNLKPKQTINKEKKIIGWRCKICGYEYMQPELPKDYECPLCGHPAEDFEPIYEE